jgi:hypothetical protein
LHELELQTRDAVYEQLGDAAARFTTAERIANARRYSERRCRDGIASSVADAFTRPRDEAGISRTSGNSTSNFADSPRAAFFHYVLAHELAIAELGARQTSAQTRRRSVGAGRGIARQCAQVMWFVISVPASRAQWPRQPHRTDTRHTPPRPGNARSRGTQAEEEYYLWCLRQ